MGHASSAQRHRPRPPLETSASTASLDQPILASYQKIILKAAWREISSKPRSKSSLSKEIWRRCNAKDSRIRDAFANFDGLDSAFTANDSSQNAKDEAICEHAGFDDHGAFIVDLLDYAFTHLDAPVLIAARCDVIGRAHRRLQPLGLRVDFWEDIGEGTADALREHSGFRRHRHAAPAIHALVGFLVDRLRNGFLQRVEVVGWVKTPHPTLDGDRNEDERCSLRDPHL